MTIVDVVDGDTMDIRYQNGTTDTIRLLGVDTPEVHTETAPDEFEGVPDTQAGRDCLRSEGEDASSHATQHLESKTVRITTDPQADTRGSYGRLLVYLHVDGQHFNYQLVADGYARVYDSSFALKDRFRAAEGAAQVNERGIWRCRTVGTATLTQSSSSGGELAVTTVHEDADGNDHENENDEYVVFENMGGGTIDLSGWTVRDEDDHTYTVPSGVTLAPGEQLTLYTGSGSDTDSELYWGSDSAIWNNGGDTIYVTGSGGETKLEYSY